jgi:hypothetical protein
MKKALAFLGIAFLAGPLFSADLLTAYKKGEIKLVPDAEFGVKTPWDMMFKAVTDKKMAFLRDGGFFKPAYADGKIYRFDANGTKIAEFGGRLGQGPGDLNGPSFLVVLHGTSLVVYETGNRRFSQFDLDGRFIKVAKIENPEISMAAPITALVALDGEKVALVVEDKTSTFWTRRMRVLIRNMTTGAETDIASFTDEKPKSPIFIKNESFDGAVYLARAGSGRLLVAYSKSPEIAFYTLEGKKISSFEIETERVPITFDHLEFVMKPDPKDVKAVEGYQKVIVANRDKILLPEFHPYYLGLGIDPDGRIILAANNLAKKTRDISWRVYSAEGRFLAAVKLNPGHYELVHPYEVTIRGDSLYTLLARPDADGTQFLARVKISD